METQRSPEEREAIRQQFILKNRENQEKRRIENIRDEALAKVMGWPWPLPSRRQLYVKEKEPPVIHSDYLCQVRPGNEPWNDDLPEGVEE